VFPSVRAEFVELYPTPDEHEEPGAGRAFVEEGFPFGVVAHLPGVTIVCRSICCRDWK